jgi:hypothetical protein
MIPRRRDLYFHHYFKSVSEIHLIPSPYPLFPVKRHLGKTKTSWLESARELYRPKYSSLSAKLVPTFAARGCHVVIVADPLRPYSRFSRSEPLFFLSSSSSVVLTRLSGPRSSRESNPDLWICSQELWPLDRRGGREKPSDLWNIFGVDVKNERIFSVFPIRPCDSVFKHANSVALFFLRKLTIFNPGDSIFGALGKVVSQPFSRNVCHVLFPQLPTNATMPLKCCFCQQHSPTWKVECGALHNHATDVSEQYTNSLFSMNKS